MLASRCYRWRGNPQYRIRADKTSERWYIFRGGQMLSEQPYPTLTKAMDAFRAMAAALQLVDQRG